MFRKRIIFLIALFIAILLVPRAHTQSAQVSPVANLIDNQNVSVLNNNLQFLQGGMNSLFNSFSQYFTGGILNPANGGTGQDSSNWPPGDYAYMSSRGHWGHIPATHGSQIFTSSGTFTASSSIVYLSMIGGGGAGAGSGGGNNGCGGGGASGSFVMNYPYTVVSGNAYTVTINGAGGTTVFDSLTMNPGASGNFTVNGNGPGGVIDQSATGETIAGSACISGNGGAGASTPFGHGGKHDIFCSTGNPASTNSGGGGGGVCVSDSLAHSGGAGASGIVIIQW